ncbi:aspartate 1-decarboxylase [Sulfoacidibacillus thermotolerans]|uniref:Aspartate 1-decarboxylase n=1 Tax=Sulfoacidibacillus thermotolerans TaxID=1765684 RepID=A0A2U3DAJ1_SULT2|nr:aspartate 1-decarboxylase [Sulfoacidibacillus thermotolerans]PWI58291.1 aspartate 1-decarboxylase [Sulfoacidibacillus thermotolerans]
MLRTLLKSKIHRATVTQTNLHYMGSITIDQRLMEEADLLENELVQIVNVNTGARFDTYVIQGARNSGQIGLNGAAARLAEPGDIVIIMSYGQYNEQELKMHQPIVVQVNEQNEPLSHVANEAAYNAELSF